MDNDSMFFPFEHIGDSLFDSDGDGALTGFETFVRDTALFDAMEDAEKAASNSAPTLYSSPTITPTIHHNMTVEDVYDEEAVADADDGVDDGFDAGLDVTFDDSVDPIHLSLGRRRAQARRWSAQLEELAFMMQSQADWAEFDMADADGAQWDRLDCFTTQMHDAVSAVQDAIDALNEAADSRLYDC